MKSRCRCFAIFWTAVILPAAALSAADTAVPKEIDIQKSVMTVRVFKSGLLSAFGHEHEISASIQQGTLSENGRSVDLTVNTRTMRVRDKDVSEKDRAEIQETMLGAKVLDGDRFPEIRFHSTAVESSGEGRWIVRGDLSLHGQTRPIRLEVQEKNGRYRGTAELKQRDFGIEPITAGGGTVKVKDGLRVEFEIVAKP